MSRKVIAKVSKSALRHNLQQVRIRAPNAKIMAIIKANAYGHGLIETARVFADADALGVACLEEAVPLRQAGINNEIVLLEGFFEASELELVQENRCTAVIHRWDQIENLSEYIKQRPFAFVVWIKINTGMNRLGFQLDEFPKAYQALSAIPQIQIKGFMSQFPRADEKENALTMRQQRLFLDAVKDLPGAKSMANSAAILGWPDTHGEWVRPGIMLYGGSPFANISAQELNLKPAMTLQSKIISIRDLKQQEQVGYGGAWENTGAARKMAVVAIGYADGYSRITKNGTPVLVNNQRARTIGRVSMDMMAIDITDIGPVNIGDPVVLWGEGLAAEEIAQGQGTICYELFCRTTNSRVKLEYSE